MFEQANFSSRIKGSGQSCRLGRCVGGCSDQYQAGASERLYFSVCYTVCTSTSSLLLLACTLLDAKLVQGWRMMEISHQYKSQTFQLRCVAVGANVITFKIRPLSGTQQSFSDRLALPVLTLILSQQNLTLSLMGVDSNLI